MSEDKKRQTADFKVISTMKQSGALGSMSAASKLMRTYNPTGLRAIQQAIDSSSIGGMSKVIEAARLTSIDTGLGATLKDMAERHAAVVTQMQRIIDAQRNPYEVIIQRHRESMAGMAKAVEAYKASLPTANLRIGAIAELNFESYGAVFERLKLDQVIGSEFQTVAKQLSEQIAVHRATVTVPKIDMSLSANIGDLLARSLQAQERLLEEQRAFHAEQREAEEVRDAKARLDRRLTYFLALIQVLSFFFMIALEVEGRWQDAEDAERAETDRTEIIQMREAIETMGAQLEVLRQVEVDRAEREDEEAKREAEADAELVAIMREIAEGLRSAEEESTNEEDGR